MSEPFPKELFAELERDWPDPVIVRRLIFQAYNHDKSETLDVNTENREELAAVIAWLRGRDQDYDLQYLFYKRRGVLVPVFSTSLSAKVSSLSQFHCPICKTRDGLFPVQVLPIRIPPASKQAISQKKGFRAAFENAIKHRFSSRPALFSKDDSLCVMIVFVTSKKRKAKDIDNMAKAMLDAVKGVLFGDDRRIDHLNLLRLVGDDEEYVCLNIRKTEINEHRDVLSKHMHHSWAGAEALDLKDFMPT